MMRYYRDLCNPHSALFHTINARRSCYDVIGTLSVTVCF